MKSLEKLEAMAEKKRENIRQKQLAIKRDTDALKDIEAEIENLKGEQFRRDINKLDLTPEEFEEFRKRVLSNKSNLLEVMNMLAAEDESQQEGAKPLYE